ncbi:MAG: chromosome partitioning protein ParB, partial [Bacteroidales bacterium]|nr:chromosome partitioning protein ParB [Bacteroidales bacterium]
CNLSQDELSEKVGKGKTTIVNYLRLLKLSKEVQIAVRDSRISMSHARVIVGFEDFEIQNKLLEEILKKNLSVHEAESLAKKIAKEVKPRRKINVRLSDKVISFKDELSTRLGSKISIVKDAKGIGKITIPFKSDDDLARIIEMLSK